MTAPERKINYHRWKKKGIKYGKWNQRLADKLKLILPTNFFEDDEPVVCAKFGCPRHLSPTEHLYSNYCFEHSPFETSALKIVLSL